MPLQFEWDARKAKANEAKHGVSFEEAVSVFADPLALIFGDSEREKREIIVGHSYRQTLMLVIFVETEEWVRLISARKATRMERKDYEENVSS